MTATRRGAPAADRVPPHSKETEESFLGVALLSREAVEYGVSHLDASDFYLPLHQRVFDAIRSLYEQGAAVNHMTVTDEIRRLGAEVKVADILGLHSNAPGVTGFERYASTVKEHSAARRALATIHEATAALYDGKDPYAIAECVADKLNGLDRIGSLPKRCWLNMDAYLDQPVPAAGEELIPGLCYRDSRIIVLASEKAGKSVALRQLGYCAASGLHPFRHTAMKPIRVAILDCENPDRELRRTGALLRKRMRTAGAWTSENLSMSSYTFGFDLRDPKCWSELQTWLEQFRPELLIAGPIYKMMVSQPNENDVRFADAFQQKMGRLLERFGCAAIFEHHAPMGIKGEREIRSMGGQRWAAWPDCTVALVAAMDKQGQPTGELIVNFPHPTRGDFEWPDRLSRGRPETEDLPWEATYRPAKRGAVQPSIPNAELAS